MGEIIMSCNHLLFRPLNDDKSFLLKIPYTVELQKKLNYSIDILKIERMKGILSTSKGIRVILKSNKKYRFISFFSSQNKEAKQIKKSEIK